jgi:hypothetical protein
MLFAHRALSRTTSCLDLWLFVHLRLCSEYAQLLTLDRLSCPLGCNFILCFRQFGSNIVVRVSGFVVACCGFHRQCTCFVRSRLLSSLRLVAWNLLVSASMCFFRPGPVGSDTQVLLATCDHGCREFGWRVRVAVRVAQHCHIGSSRPLHDARCNGWVTVGGWGECGTFDPQSWIFSPPLPS